MVMAYQPGRTLQKFLHQQREQQQCPLVPERVIRSLFYEIAQGLREVHANRMLHLDLKSANLYLPRNGGAILLDFRAARQTLSASFPKLTAMYTPGYAAPGIRLKTSPLGPWTDIYGLGASIYACMTGGGAPQGAELRRAGDAVSGQLDGLKKYYSSVLVDAVRDCLMLEPEARIPSLLALQKILAQPQPIAAEPVVQRKPLTARMTQWLRRSAGRGKQQVD